MVGKCMQLCGKERNGFSEAGITSTLTLYI